MTQMNKEIIEMLKSVIEAAENGGTVEVIIHAEDDEHECTCEECTCGKKDSPSGSIEEQLEKDNAAWDKLAQEMAIATLCMRESKILTEKVNFVVEEDGEQGVGTVNDVLDFCARHHKVKLQAVIK